ncbi:MAG TPA: DUF456 domain-containing protein [Gammaproteobacteria bacterium]
MTTTLLLSILGVTLVVLGLLGVVLPALPGPPLMLGGFIVLAWAEDFFHVGAGTLVALGVLTAIMVAVDFLAGALGARRYGATKRAVIGATLGAVVGLFFGFVGVLLGPFVGAVLGELSGDRGLQAASRAGVGATIGLLLGTAAKIALAFAMIGVYLVVRFL